MRRETGSGASFEADTVDWASERSRYLSSIARAPAGPELNQSALAVDSHSLAVTRHDGGKGAGMGDKGGKKDKDKNKQQQLTKQKQEEQKKQDKARPKTP
jgi:hypothetical protein